MVGVLISLTKIEKCFILGFNNEWYYQTKRQFPHVNLIFKKINTANCNFTYYRKFLKMKLGIRSSGFIIEQTTFSDVFFLFKRLRFAPQFGEHHQNSTFS